MLHGGVTLAVWGSGRSFMHLGAACGFNDAVGQQLDSLIVAGFPHIANGVGTVGLYLSHVHGGTLKGTRPRCIERYTGGGRRRDTI